MCNSCLFICLPIGGPYWSMGFPSICWRFGVWIIPFTPIPKIIKPGVVSWLTYRSLWPPSDFHDYTYNNTYVVKMLSPDHIVHTVWPSFIWKHTWTYASRQPCAIAVHYLNLFVISLFIINWQKCVTLSCYSMVRKSCMFIFKTAGFFFQGFLLSVTLCFTDKRVRREPRARKGLTTATNMFHWSNFFLFIR